MEPPLDAFDAAVRLEFDGVTDVVAKVEHGFGDTLAMGRAAVAERPRKAAPRTHSKAPNWLAAYFHGVSFAMPVVLCAVSMYCFRFSLWGGDLRADVASAVAVGTVASFLVTGGFVQSMARRAMFYITTDAIPVAAGTCLRWGLGGAGALAATGLAGLGLNLFFDWFPFPLAALALGFHIALGLLWLSCGVLYVLEWNSALAAVTVAGLSAVALGRFFGGFELVMAQLGGVGAAAALATVWAAAVFRHRLRAKGVAYPQASPARTAYLTAPYFAYGLLYYSFLFADRLIAWTAGTNELSLPLWFRGSYEAPLDIALAAFILQVGWVHPALLRFQHAIQDTRQDYRVAETDAFNGQMTMLYWKQTIRYLLWGLACAVVVFGAGFAAGAFVDRTSAGIAACAIGAYTLVVVGLWNTGLLFSLSLPRVVLYAISAALVSDITTGYLLSRVFSFEAAVGGFLVGALIFAAISTHGVLVRLPRLDYLHVAASL